MYKWILIFLLIPSVCWGAVNEKYSYKDFMNMSFVGVDAKEFNNSEIVGSNFYQHEKLNESIFPEGMTGVIFIKCNLDNVKVEGDNIVDKSSTHKKVKLQKDLEYWIVDDLGEVKEPVEKVKYVELSISIDKKDIPVEKLKESIITMKEKELNEKDISTIIIP